MVLLEMLANWLDKRFCKHDEAVICKYGEHGEYLPLNRQYYRCVNCFKQLEPITYFDLGK